MTQAIGRRSTLNRFAASLLLCASAFSALAASPGPAVDTCEPVLAQEIIRDDVIVPLFDALRAGRLDDIRRYLSPAMAKDYETLFSQNSTYDEYLRAHYKDSAFELLDVRMEGDHYEANVLVYWPDGRSMEVPLQLGGAAANITGTLSSGECP